MINKAAAIVLMSMIVTSVVIMTVQTRSNDGVEPEIFTSPPESPPSEKTLGYTFIPTNDVNGNFTGLYALAFSIEPETWHADNFRLVMTKWNGEQIIIYPTNISTYRGMDTIAGNFSEGTTAYVFIFDMTYFPLHFLYNMSEVEMFCDLHGIVAGTYSVPNVLFSFVPKSDGNNSNGTGDIKWI